MMIAIHNRPNSFSDYWINYCKSKNVPYKLVDCYKSTIIDELQDVSGLMWHWTQNSYKDKLFAIQLTQSIERMGIKVFPNTNTAWHFDDKLGQKYLFEAMGFPAAKSYAFYDFETFKVWANSTFFPKVFKLRAGAGSFNVKLIRHIKEAIKLAKIAFSRGFLSADKKSQVEEYKHRFQKSRDIGSLLRVIKRYLELFRF